MYVSCTFKAVVISILCWPDEMIVYYVLADWRLNPSLLKRCRMDIPKFCSDVAKEQDTEVEGKVIHCLKQQYVKKVCHHNYPLSHDVVSWSDIKIDKPLVGYMFSNFICNNNVVYYI